MRLLLLLSALLTALVGTSGTASAGALPRQQVSAPAGLAGAAATIVQAAARPVAAAPRLVDVLASDGFARSGEVRGAPLYASRLRV